MNAELFVNHLSQITFKGVFNPYRDLCDEHDHSESPAIRRLNLQRYLDAAVNCGVESVWLGRDCGYRGGRRTGIALTDELNLEALDHQFGISGLAKATVGQPLKERTATEVWKIIREVDAKVFLWNIFPFHPFEAGNPMSNRRHSAREFNECRDILCCLLEWLQPKMIIAIGADAHKALYRLEFQVSSVRHPSYGGHLEFANGIRQLYST
ncbi:uracil-DNA glycosylase [Microcoleus sp. SVA1_A1]|uniref:uracil-DNA glycosylase n=1 Tax=Microcoleus sp. SVA1_A1 TaxID=2818946 RepID=UPI002FCF5231